MITNEEIIKDLESLAKERYIENADWNCVIDQLEDYEYKKLNDAYRKVYKRKYPGDR